MGIKVLIIGAGVYVCGRGTDGFGTILPAVLQTAKAFGLIDRLTIVGTGADSINLLKDKQHEIEARLGTSLPTRYLPESGRDPEAYQQALRREHDAAIIAVPDPLHYTIGRAAIEAGLHTLLVKPFVTKLQDGIELARLADRKGVLGAVEFHKRYDTANRLLRGRLIRGELGELLYFHIAYSQRKMVPLEHFAGWSADTNIFQYLGVHYVDLIFYFTGAMPVRVMACGQKTYLAGQGLDTPDAMQVMIEWRESTGRRFVSSHLTNWIDPNTSSAMSDQKISVVGTAGRIDSDQKNRGLQVVTDANGVEDINPYFSQFLPAADGKQDFEGYGCQSVMQFLRDVDGLNAARTTLESLARERATFASSLVSQAVIEAANRSLAEQQQWVDVDTSWNDLLP
jgi:D-galacturonate reductase